jgi:ABC-type oligopeptide transport system ATPase subunit
MVHRETMNLTYLFITHDLSVVDLISTQALLYFP